MGAYLTLLRQRPQVRNLWLAALVSFSGDWFNAIATLILVNRYTDSTTAVGALFVARTLPPFFLGPLAGVVADRFSRRKVLIATDLLRFFIVLGFLLVDGPEDAPLIYALTIAQFVVSSFFEPAQAAFLPSLVEGGQELLLANTLHGVTWSAMLALGAALGGLVTGLFGVSTAIIVDAVSFLISALFIWRIGAPPLPRPAAGETPNERSSGWGELIEGFRYVRHHPRTGLTASVKALTQIGSPNLMIAVYATQVFAAGEGAAEGDSAFPLGLLYAAAGLGAILGPLVANHFAAGAVPALQNAIGVSFVVVSAGWLLLGWAPSLLIAAAALLLRHMGGSTNWTYSNVLLQMRVPDRYLGRVFGLDLALFTLAASLSVWLSGIFLDNGWFGPRQLSFFLALGSLLPLLPWMWLNRNDPLRKGSAPGKAAE